MQFYGKCLIVVADGENARLFEERRRGGPLTEQSSWVVASHRAACMRASPSRPGRTAPGLKTSTSQFVSASAANR